MKYYCIGIKGTGMSTLAQILHDLGNQVSGYDDAKEHKFTEVGLEERHIPIYYDGNHEIDPDTVVTYSVAFSDEHPEIQRVKNLGLKIIKYNELMGEVINMFKSIGVSGTHGKTTTASLIRKILEQAGGCNYFIGAGDGYASAANDYFVVESDEFNRHFTAYHPMYSVITNIEAEHLECYKDIDDIRDAFETFANQTSKLVVANGDNLEVKKINYNTRVLFYGFGFHNDVIIKNLRLLEEGSRFDIYINEELYGSFEVPLYGKHMVSNVCAAILICRELGIEKEIIHEALINFKNAKRRFAIEKIRNTIIVDDYAHHPTEIKATIEAAKQRFPDKRIVVIFRPNTYSRTKDFKNEFIEALNTADKAFLTAIKCDREDPKKYPGISSKTIINGLNDGDDISVDTISKLQPELDSVICILSCAYVDDILNAVREFIANQPEDEE
ncbi:MAG: UDP-N-acetylmuramate--L-alanine ligase [Bacilli bacterium]|nr:UDP-N-acetylmuramate--L-alanine ligase [Bacilli bacterium]